MTDYTTQEILKLIEENGGPEEREKNEATAEENRRDERDK